MAVEAIKEHRTLAELSKHFEVSPVVISRWKKEFLENMSKAFGDKDNQEPAVNTEKLYAQIGQLKVENDRTGDPVSKKKLEQDRPMSERVQLVKSREGKLSLRKQCELLNLHRSRIYYMPLGERPENLKIMRLMDAHAHEHPAEGVKSMQYMLEGKGYCVNPKRVRRLLRKMGLMAVYPQRTLSKLGSASYIRPYLLRNKEITHANQAWSIDITYIPMAKGFMYCTAIIDIYSRKIVGWGISNSLEARWCIDVLQKAIETHGKPQIINSDQGSQFTSALWTSTVDELGVQISMDGKGRAIDNRWIERFWKTLKYNYIYLNPPENGLELYEGVDYYIRYYNDQKKHHTIQEIPSIRYQKSLKNAA